MLLKMENNFYSPLATVFYCSTSAEKCRFGDKAFDVVLEKLALL
jgi:hypothetical protein